MIGNKLHNHRDTAKRQADALPVVEVPATALRNAQARVRKGLQELAEGFVEEIKEGTLQTECGQTVDLEATFPGRIAKGQKQHWERAGKGVRAKFRIEGTGGFYVLAGSIERGVTFHKLRVGKEVQ